ncbi:MAG: MBL fold metallo-hydrolase [Clostridia bacterium]|nr:MBL fold metallo-hydrolase [Clostridia bacterium]
MMKLCPLCSGSSGNSVYVGVSEYSGLLVDVGINTKRIELLLNENNIDIHNIKAILITHEHIDHVAGVKVFAKKYGIKIYASEGTITSLREKGIITDKHEFEILTSKEKNLGFAEVRPFFTSHDCSQGTGYVISGEDGESVAVCTDLGYVSDEVKQALCGCKSVVIESNHDVMMLQNGPYPYYLKRRILSNVGHLSNDSCAELLPYLVNNGTKNIVLSHLSEKNNIPELARQTALYSFEKNSMKENVDFNLFVAPKINSKVIGLID